jgi:hypothetical protein
MKEEPDLGSLSLTKKAQNSKWLRKIKQFKTDLKKLPIFLLALWLNMIKFAK